MTSRSKLVREDIKWQDLLHHFRLVQNKHEKSRRQAMGEDMSSFSLSEAPEPNGRSPPTSRPPNRRKVTGEIMIPPNNLPAGPFSPKAALSPLNPRARAQTAGSPVPSQLGLTPAAALAQQKQKRNISLTRK
jgi:vacuole morphology and inheritance protein 14